MTDTRILPIFIIMDESEKEPISHADFQLSMMNIQKHHPNVDWGNSEMKHASAVLFSDLLELLKKIEDEYLRKRK